MIPKIIHQIWFGKKEPPVEKMRLWALINHPDWRHVLWTEKNIPDLMNQGAFDKTKSLTIKSDIARYEILYKIGGVYVDCDMLPATSLNKWLENRNGIAFVFHDDYWKKFYCNGLLMFPKGHPFLLQMIHEISALEIPASKSAHGYHLTGPGLLTKVLYKMNWGISKMDHHLISSKQTRDERVIAIHDYAEDRKS